MDNNAKLRPLYLAKILYERTDEDHYLTTMQLAQILEEEYGIPAHRQTIKTDIERLAAACRFRFGCHHLQRRIYCDEQSRGGRC